MTENGKRQLFLAEQENVLTICGEIDYANATKLLRRLSRLRSMYDTVVVDIGGVTYMDSTGFGSLLRVCRELRHRGGQMVLRHPSVHVHRMLEVMDMLRFFSVEEKLPESPCQPL